MTNAAEIRETGRIEPDHGRERLIKDPSFFERNIQPDCNTISPWICGARFGMLTSRKEHGRSRVLFCPEV